MLPSLPRSWARRLSDEVEQPYFTALDAFLEDEYRAQRVYPPAPLLFHALERTSFARVRVLLLGQDPYARPGQAHGLAFSVPRGVTPPPSLRNMFRELERDLGIANGGHGDLTTWARQGVLLLNAVLTVREGRPSSHAGKGWERFTDAVIRTVSRKRSRVVFLLWGAYAQKKASLVDENSHVILPAAHPSPLSARNGFFGSRPFSRTNQALEAAGREPIDWRLPA